MSVVERKKRIEADHPRLSIQRQCDLIGLPRSSYYRGKVMLDKKAQRTWK